MPTNTTRLALVQWVGSDAPSVYRTGNATNMTTLDGAVTITQGTLAARPAGSYYGQTYYATDVARWYFFNGTAWQIIMISATSWTVPSLTANWTNQNFAYRLNGDKVEFKGQIINNTGSLQTSTILFTLPAGSRPLATWEPLVVGTSNQVPPIVFANGNVENQIAVGNGGIVAFDAMWFSLT